MGWPKITYREEGMREGMQIESADISIDDKVRLLGVTKLPGSGIPARKSIRTLVLDRLRA